MVKDTSGRSCFSETMRSAPFASLDFVHAGTCNTGVFPGGGIFERSRVCWAEAGSHRSSPRITAVIDLNSFMLFSKNADSPPQLGGALHNGTGKVHKRHKRNTKSTKTGPW